MMMGEGEPVLMVAGGREMEVGEEIAGGGGRGDGGAEGVAGAGGVGRVEEMTGAEEGEMAVGAAVGLAVES